MIPDDWPVASMSDFFTRAMKRQLHDRATWRSKSKYYHFSGVQLRLKHFTVIKAISAGQNSAIAEEYARTVGTLPSIIERPPADSPSGFTLPDEGSIATAEYGSIHEKSPIYRPQSRTLSSGEKEIEVKAEKSGYQSPPVVDLSQRWDGAVTPSDN